LVPSSSGWMMVSFQRAWTMPMRRELPSWTWGAGPLVSVNILAVCGGILFVECLEEAIEV